MPIRTVVRCCFVLAALSLRYSAQLALAQETTGERVFFNAKVFTADPMSPFASAVVVRGDKILAVGTLPEVLKSASAAAERVDLRGGTLFPGFIDSHSHSVDGGLGLISADVSDKVQSIDQLPPFVAEAKRSGKGMMGDILEVDGMPLEFWSHTDDLNARFSTGPTRIRQSFFRAWTGIRAGRTSRCSSARGLLPHS